MPGVRYSGYLWFMVQGSGFRVQGSGFRVHDLWFTVNDSGYEIPKWHFKNEIN